MDIYDVALLTRGWGVFVSVFCAFQITPHLVGRVKYSLILLMDFRIEERVWNYTMTYSCSLILPFSLSSPLNTLSPVLGLCIHMKSILMLCPGKSEIDVHIKVTKTNCVLYFLAAVPVDGSISSLHQGATSYHYT